MSGAIINTDNNPTDGSTEEDKRASTTTSGTMLGVYRKIVRSAPGRRGLRNRQNVCYINCILQILGYTLPLRDFLLDSRVSVSGSFTVVFRHIIHSLWSRKYKKCSVDGSKFKFELQKFQPFFGDDKPHDAHHLLITVLRTLDFEKEIPVKDWLQCRTTEWWSCAICKIKNCVGIHENWTLSLPIPLEKKEVDIDDCFNKILRHEEVEEKYCNSCRKDTKGYLITSIEEFPDILIVHLTRSYGEEGKLTTDVIFPVDCLDISKYGTVEGESAEYKLFGVANHYGSASNGHYKALCRHVHSQDWFIFNDEIVRRVSSKYIVSEAAYILFYFRTKK